MKEKNLLSNELKLEKQAIEYNSYDIYLYETLKSKNNRINDICEKGKEIYKYFDELYQDLFSAFYRFYPEFFPENRIKFSYIMNYYLMKDIFENEEFKKLREFTISDEMNTMISMELFGEKLIELLKNKKEELDEFINLEAENTKDEEKSDGIQNKEDKPQEIDYEKALEKLKEAKEKYKNIFSKNEQFAITKVIKNVKHEIIESNKNSLINWGIELSTSFKKLRYDSKLEVLEKIRNSKKLRKIAEIAGKYRLEAINSQRRNFKKGSDSITNVKTGNNLNNLLPVELMKLGDNDLEKVFFKNYEEKNLLEYDLNNKSNKNKGPIIICIDNSGSMEGEPEIFSKATALGILEIAKIQRRSVFVIHFDCGDKESLHTNTFLKTGYDINEIIDMAEYFTGGGTDFEPALDLAREKIETENNFSKADIVFITDGQAPVSREWLNDFNNWRKEKNVNVYSIIIDTTYNTEESVKLFSDQVSKFSSLPKDGLASLPTELYSVL